MVRKLCKFDYFKPGTVAEALTLLQEYREKAGILAGGTDLLVFMKQGAKQLRYVIDIKGIASLNHITWNPADGLKIGALATMQSIIRNSLICEHFPMLVQAAKALGHPQIRSRATMTGSICTASPSGDMAPSLLALNADVTVVSPAGERTIPVEDMFTGPFATVLSATDLVTGIHVRSLPPGSAGSYCWQPKITTVDETLVGAAAVVTLDGNMLQEVRIGLGSVASTPMRAKGAEAFLRGKETSNRVFAEAADIAVAETRPRTRADYRREVTKILVEQALSEAVAQAVGKRGDK